jgi:hypothetical protein
MIGKDRRPSLRNQLGLVVHVLPASGDEEDRGRSKDGENAGSYPRSQKRDLGHPTDHQAAGCEL